jgi:hypothetical protein
MPPSGACLLPAYSSCPGGPPWGLFLNPQSSNSSPFSGGGPAGTPMLGFDAPQLFSLPPGWANAAGEAASIITSATIANSAVSRLRIALPPSTKGGTLGEASPRVVQRYHGSKHRVPRASPKWTIFVCQMAILSVARVLHRNCNALHQKAAGFITRFYKPGRGKAPDSPGAILCGFWGFKPMKMPRHRRS